MASRGQNHLLENHWSRGEAADLPQWGRSLSGFGKVTTGKALSTVMCDGEEKGLRPRAKKKVLQEAGKHVFLKSCSGRRFFLKSALALAVRRIRSQ